MKYDNILPARFLRRPNRFLAHALLEDGREVVCHVKNTGRCRELLRPGAPVYLQHCPDPRRKTAFDLIAVDKDGLLINMDAQAPNRVFQEWALAGNFRPLPFSLRPETTYGTSRFDFYWESSSRRGFVEVKGVTLEEGGVARFPDAPTLRGVRHLEELMLARREGYEAAVCFVVQMAGIRCFRPNDATHPAFGDALRRCAAAGVEILCFQCAVSPDALIPGGPVPVELERETRDPGKA